MSNHYHLVVRIGSAKDFTDNEVIQRWLCLYRGPLLAQKAVNGETLTRAEEATLAEIASVWRERLQDLSWFMKCLNEPIAKRANREDECTGHFWESRFKSQALNTEEALLSCMAYVDLNPIRSKMATKPESSDYTSIRERISGPNPKLLKALKKALGTIPRKALLPFTDTTLIDSEARIPYTFFDYLKLLDWTGRIVSRDDTGVIPKDSPPILVRLGMSSAYWLESSNNFEEVFHRRYRKVA